MNVKIIWSTIAGSITILLITYILYTFILPVIVPESVPANNEILRKEPLFIPFFLAEIFLAMVFSLIILKWTDTHTFINGMKTGFVVGLLLSLGVILELYSSSIVYPTARLMFADIVVQLVRLSLMGGVIGFVLGK